MSMWGKIALAGVLWSVAGLASAQDAPAFPATLEREPLLLWLQRETDIMPDRVVAVTPQAITSIVSTFPSSGGQGPRAVIRSEALSSETVLRTNALSWHVSLSADCSGRRVRLGETTGYPQRNLLGDRMPLRAAETEWRAPERGTALDAAWRAVCEPGFKGPFGANTLKVAQETPPATAAAPVAPAPAAAPQRPAPMARQTPPPAPQAAASTPRRGGLAAQVGASPSEPDARSLLAALGSSVDGRETWVEKAVVGGRTWYRSVVGGFADAGEANGFCAGLKASGRGCFVRPVAR